MKLSKIDDFIMGAILFMCGVMSGLALILLAGDAYYRATSETVCTEMELAISAKDKKTTINVRMIGKVSTVQSDTDYFIYCGDIEIEVSYSEYNSLSIGDCVVVVKKDWVRKGEILNTNYYLKGAYRYDSCGID